jgi:UV DNA damage repair endonuclease
LDDVVEIHDRILDRGFNIPIVLDWFHFECYYGRAYSGEHISTILDSWEGRHVKMHISEQHPDLRRGAHSEYVQTIPKLLFDIAKHNHIFLMVEAKAKEKAVIYLKKKYGL